MELPLTTPSPDHFEFDEMCSALEEFEPLPTLTSSLDADTGIEEETSLDGQILAGLVVPC